MPPKRGVKRKAASTNAKTTNGSASRLAPPDRATWPGWVEMESEPAFFNTMLKDMGVRGVKVQEVYGMDDDLLAVLPQPIHALIFLFKYRETDTTEQTSGSCPKDIWFANQVPDFACATFALLNIVNNIPGLILGKDLQTFKDFTKGMNPLDRGDALDGFDFVRRIHNSFASENDMMQADMHMKGKAEKLKKRRATEKAVETRKAKQKGTASTQTPLKGKSANATATPTRSSNRKKPVLKASPKASSKEQSPREDPDGDFSPSAKTKAKAVKEEVETETEAKTVESAKTEGLRRSGRQPKPSQTKTTTVTPDDDDEDGFHFIAYMPINGNVWKLDGLNRFPQKVGSIEDAGGNWMHIAQPALVDRMAQYEESDIQFNLMAIVHDTLATDQQALVQNVKTLQAVDKKLDGVYEDWREMEGAETGKDVITADSLGLGITLPDIEAATVDDDVEADIEKEDDLLKLIELRKKVIGKQSCLRATVRDAAEANNADDEKSQHRRHDYGALARGWLNALAEAEALSGLVEA